jgi:hypothetical protein
VEEFSARLNVAAEDLAVDRAAQHARMVACGKKRKKCVNENVGTTFHCRQIYWKC